MILVDKNQGSPSPLRVWRGRGSGFKMLNNMPESTQLIKVKPRFELRLAYYKVNMQDGYTVLSSSRACTHTHVCVCVHLAVSDNTWT